MIIAFVIWSFCAVIFLMIGLGFRKSKDAVGFFTFVKPPVVSDVGRYNRAVAALWIASAVILELLGIPFLFAEQNSPVFFISTIGALVLVIGMIFVHIRIEIKYRLK